MTSAGGTGKYSSASRTRIQSAGMPEMEMLRAAEKSSIQVKWRMVAPKDLAMAIVESVEPVSVR